MSEFGRRADWSEGRRDSRIDLEHGGRYLGIPQIGFAGTLSPVTINPVSTNSGAVHHRVFTHLKRGSGALTAA